MPFYEYECQACGEHHEALQKISDPPLKKCPHCGKSRLRKLVSAPVFRLKGGGWYETDFKSDGEKKRNLAGDEKPAVEDKKAAPAAQPPKADAPAPAAPAAAESKPRATTRQGGSKPAAKSKPKPKSKSKAASRRR